MFVTTGKYDSVNVKSFCEKVSQKPVNTMQKCGNVTLELGTQSDIVLNFSRVNYNI